MGGVTGQQQRSKKNDATHVQARQDHESAGESPKKIIVAQQQQGGAAEISEKRSRA